METSASKSRKTSKKSTTSSLENRIQDAYVDHLLNTGNRPPSVFKFCTDLGIKEDAFYEHFGSFEGVERQIWKSFLVKTTSRLKADKQYIDFSTREKVLAFYFTLFEELKRSRSFILLQLANRNKLEIVPESLKDFKKEFETYIHQLMESGKASGEVAKRPYIEKGYPQIFWFHLGFLLMFWKEDDSPAFEKTDAAIEKSVNLAFDLIGKGAVDSVFDFAKFLYQTKVM
jgi:hypothetical protein